MARRRVHPRGARLGYLLALLPLAHATEYRPINGTGNNQTSPTQGAYMGRFRDVKTYYSDGISAYNDSLPNARLISNSLFGAPVYRYNTYNVAALAAAWGQFVAHDLIRTSAPDENSGTTDVGEVEEIIVAVPTGDPDMDPLGTGTQTITTNRNIYDQSTSRPGVPRAQLNTATGWLDVSTVYGHSDERAAVLREGAHGRLWGDPVNGVPFNSVGAAPGECTNEEHPGIANPCGGLRLTGDERGNVAPGILSLHGLWVLRHNWWAGVLAGRDPSLGDEVLFQEARKRVIAEVNQITYGEYLAGLGISLPPYSGYHPEVDAGVDPRFAIAAYRYGHAGLNTLYTCLGEGGENLLPPLLLRDVYFRPASYLNVSGCSISGLLRGLVVTPEKEIGMVVVPDVRNFLEGLRNDLSVMDIMRGREFGLPTFAQARQELGLRPVVGWDDITNDPDVAAALAAVYATPQQVDLWVGGLAEAAGGDVFTGATNAVIIRDQFLRSRDGDRFWWANPQLTGVDGGPYLPAKDVASINAVTLATVVADVTDWADPPQWMFVAQPLPSAPTPTPAPVVKGPTAAEAGLAVMAVAIVLGGVAACCVVLRRRKGGAAGEGEAPPTSGAAVVNPLRDKAAAAPIQQKGVDW